MFFKKYSILIIFTVFILPASVNAGFVTESDAISVAKNWLAMNEAPMEEPMGKTIREIQRYQGGKYGIPGYYVVFLDPNGWVIIAADDQFEPVLAFGRDYLTSKVFEESVLSHFFHIQSPVSEDSMFPVNYSETSQTPKPRNRTYRRWQQLRLWTEKAKLQNTMSTMNAITEDLLDDLVVKPLLGERGSWLQWQPDVLAAYDQNGKPIPENIAPYHNFYNFKTTWNNSYYPVGCTNLSIGMIMALFASQGKPPIAYPISPSGESMVGKIPTFLVEDKLAESIDVEQQGSANVLGGSAGNGAYDWEKITYPFKYYPDAEGLSEYGDSDSLQDNARNETASLLRDIGLLAQSRYLLPKDGGTGTPPTAAFLAMKNHLGFKSANYFHFPVYDDNVFVYTGYPELRFFNDIYRAIIPNLNASVPVIANITIAWVEDEESGPKLDSDGHSFIIDGYGFQEYKLDNGRVPYFHAYLGYSLDSPNDFWFAFNTSNDNLYASLQIPVTNELFPELFPDSNDILLWHRGSLVYNLVSAHDYPGDAKPLPEIVTGRLWANGKVIKDAKITYDWNGFGDSERGEKNMEAFTNDKGVFAFRVGQRSTLSNLRIESPSIIKGLLDKVFKNKRGADEMHWNAVPESREKFGGLNPEINDGRTVYLHDYSDVGNKLLNNVDSSIDVSYGDIVLDKLCLTEFRNNLAIGIRDLYDFPLPYGHPVFDASNWDFTGVRALFVDPYDFDTGVTQPWYNALVTKIKDFVIDGGTIYRQIAYNS